MSSSTASNSTDNFPLEKVLPQKVVETYEVSPIPARHEAEADMFARQVQVPGNHQSAFGHARIALIGAGGLNGLTGLGLVRSGCRLLTIIDHDLVERTNLPRQLYFAEDLAAPKAVRLARNLVPHAVAGATLTGVALRWEEALDQLALPFDLLIVGVDNNACRESAAREARIRRIPAVFTMLSRDSMRCQAFLQGPDSTDPCLWCALPNLDPEKAAPCAAAVISSCYLASAFAVFFAHRALMGWPETVEPFNWREADLLGSVPDRASRIQPRPTCQVCATL